MNLALIGYGKMGQMVEDVCRAQEDLRIAGVVDQGRLPSLRAVPSPDVAIDFSYPGNLLPLLADALELKVPLVLGTTGLSAAQEESIREAARSVAIVRAQNFSVGVTVMRRIAAEMARALGEGLLLNATGPRTLRFLPPLICGKSHVDALIERLGRLL